MKSKNGVNYKTIVDAASDLNVSVDTMRRYIRSEFLPRPPREFFGRVGVQTFSESYIREAKEILKNAQK